MKDATNLNLKCMAPRLPGSTYKYKAILIGWVPAWETSKQYEHCAGDKVYMRYTVDALVILQEMDKGKIVQVPMFEIEIVDEWYTKE